MPALLNTNAFEFLARLMVLFLVLPVHEFAHALAATRLGDPTPEKQGRLTLNPFAHLDLFGSLALLLFGFGWGKSVRVDPQHFKKPRRDMAITAFAGPVSNIIMAAVFMAVLKLAWVFVESPRYHGMLYNLFMVFTLIITINLTLAVFNLLPIPPLDGSKILGALLPPRLYYGMAKYEGMITVLLLVLLYTGILYIPINWATGHLLTFLDFITRPIDLLAR